MPLSEQQIVEVSTGLIQRNLVSIGDHILRSGAYSPIYVDLRPGISVDHRSEVPYRDQIQIRNNIVNAYATLADDVPNKYHHIEAIPEAVVSLMGMVAHVRGESALQRRIKTKDDHGINELILGNVYPGETVLLGDDLISTAGAKIEESELVRAITSEKDGEGNIVGSGVNIFDVIALVNRGATAIETAREAGLNVITGFHIDEVLKIGKEEGLILPRMFDALQVYFQGGITTKKQWDDLYDSM